MATGDEHGGRSRRCACDRRTAGVNGRRRAIAGGARATIYVRSPRRPRRGETTLRSPSHRLHEGPRRWWHPQLRGGEAQGRVRRGLVGGPPGCAMSTNSRWRCAGQAPRIGRVLIGDEFRKNKTTSQHRAYLFHHVTFFTTSHFSLLYSKHYFTLFPLLYSKHYFTLNTTLHPKH